LASRVCVDLLRDFSWLLTCLLLAFQLKYTHLVSAKAPLPEEAIFKRNQVAAEKRRAARKVQHKELEIAKHDRNDDCIKRRKAGERDVSSDEDPSSEPAWSGDEPIAAVDWSDMLGSSTPSSPRVVEVTSSRRPKTATRESQERCGLELVAGPPPRSRRSAGDPLSYVTWWLGRL
jgi:hypothetical protein